MHLSNSTPSNTRDSGVGPLSATEMSSEASEAEDIPCRPSSRLGFNTSTLANCCTAGETANQPCSDTASIRALASHNEQMCDVKAPPSSSDDVPAPATDGDNKGSHCAEKGLDTVSSSKIPAASGFSKSASPPRKPVTAVSRLCFPFVKTSPRRKNPVVPPPPRHKHSCFPTKFAPYDAGRSAPVHERHKYRHHGHSRLSLEHLKSLWSAREDEWEGTSHDKLLASVVSGPVVHPTTHPGSSHHPDKVTHTVPAPMSIHPRRGDLSSLRDPYCVEIDRSFISLPTWTIAKTLWMHDLQLALVKRRPRLVINIDDDISDAESELEMEMSRSTSFSNYSEDSESTLIDSEAESDYDGLSIKMRSLSSTSTSSIASPASSPIPPRDFTNGQWNHSSNFDDVLAQHPALTTKPAWTTNWYHRWEVLKGHPHQLPQKDNCPTALVYTGSVSNTQHPVI